MQEEGNVWVQEHIRTRLDVRVIAGDTAPRNIAYDERSGNLIAAMGIQGVVVGTPDARVDPVRCGTLLARGLLLLQQDGSTAVQRRLPGDGALPLSIRDRDGVVSQEMV